MSAYAIMIRDKMIDADAFAIYSKMAGEARGDHQIKPLAFYGASETAEGLEADGVVLLEFPDMAAAKAWYYSDAYQAAAAQRKRASEYRVIFVEGL